MKRRGMGNYFNYFVLILSLYVSMSSMHILPFRNPAKVKIDNDGKVDRENLIEADEIEIVDKGEINQRRNS